MSSRDVDILLVRYCCSKWWYSQLSWWPFSRL